MDKNSKDYFWQMQSTTTFCKAKSDWLDFDKIHLSFVEHSGKSSGFKQKLAIEGALKLHGSDGAIYLSEIILGGYAADLAKKKREKASAEGQKYCEPIFRSMGGTVASRTSCGTPMHRQFSVEPGASTDYVFKMSTCEGVQDANGIIQPKQGATWSRIIVPMSKGDLVDFARCIQMEVAAYRTAQMLGMTKAQETPHTDEERKQTEEVQKENTPLRVAMIYETSGAINGGFPFPVRGENSLKELQKAIKDLCAMPERYVANPGEYQEAEKLILSGECGNCCISLIGKNDPSKQTTIVVVLNELL